jgi:hypothetical protein
MSFTPFHPGDTLWFCGRGFESRAIALGTCSFKQLFQGQWISHCGIIDGCGELVESTTLNDKALDAEQRAIRGVQFNDPTERISAYSGEVFLARLTQDEKLNKGEQLRLTRYLHRLEGRAYDKKGAFFAGTKVIKYLFDPDSESLFCSELVAMALMIVDRLGREQNPSTYTPAKLVRRLVSGGAFESLKKVN